MITAVTASIQGLSSGISAQQFTAKAFRREDSASSPVHLGNSGRNGGVSPFFTLSTVSGEQVIQKDNIN